MSPPCAARGHDGKEREGTSSAGSTASVAARAVAAASARVLRSAAVCAGGGMSQKLTSAASAALAACKDNYLFALRRGNDSGGEPGGGQCGSYRR